MSLSTFFEIKEATADAVIDIEVMTAAREIAWDYANGDKEKLDRISEMMFAYSTLLASHVATRVSHLIMGEDFDKMADEALEIQDMFNLIENGDN
jgi:hypothetical protein